MKRVLTLALTMAIGTIAFAQKNTDPSVSVNNYKHANKAAYAKKNKLDKSPELSMVTVAENADYKHPGKKTKAVKKASVAVGTGSTSHKHPLGL